jgi:integrase
VERSSKSVRGRAGISKIQRGKRISYMVSYRIDGRQRTKTRPTMKAALEFQASVRDPMRAREIRKLEGGKILLRDYFPQWLEGKKNLAPSTRRRYEDVGIHYICSGLLGRLSVASIQRDDVREWIRDLERRGIGAASIDKSYRTLRACLEDASLDGKAVGNPARRISVQQPEDREPFFLTADQVEAVANNVLPRDRALVYFLAYTGARMGEATALRVKNLILVKKRVQIVESSAEVAGRKLPSGKTKTGRSRSVHLSDELITELGTHLQQFGQRQDGELDPESYVFTGERGAQIRQGNWRVRVFQPACRRLGIVRGVGGVEVPRVHDLRHTAASLAAKAGYTLHEVKEMLGHSTIKTTSDRYLHLFEDSMRERAGSLGEIMANAKASASSVAPIATVKKVEAS